MATGVYDPETEDEQRYHPPKLSPLDDQAAGNPANPAGHDVAAGDSSDPRGEGPDKLDQAGLRDAEGSGGLFNGGGKGRAGEGLAAAEKAAAIAGGGTAVAGAKALATGAKKFFWSSKKRKRNSVAGGITAVAVGGVVVGGTLLSGPAQFVHIAQLLQEAHFSTQQDESDARVSKLIRYARFAPKGDTYRTNLNAVGNRLADGFEAKLREQGLASSYSRLFGLKKGYVVDTQKEIFKGKTNEQIQQELRSKFDNPDLKFSTITDEAGGKHMYMEQPSGYRESIAFNRTVMREAGYGKTTSAIGARIMGARDGVTWHPLQKLDKKLYGKIEDKIGQWKKQKDQDISKGVPDNPEGVADPKENQGESQTQKDKTTADADGTAAQGNEIASEGNSAAEAAHSGNDPEGKTLTSFTDKVSVKITAGGAAAAGVLCMARGIAQQAGDVKQKQVELPLARTGMRAISEGNQVMAGQDIDLEQLGQDSKQFYDAANKTSWSGAQSIQAETGNPNWQKAPSKDQPDDTLKTIGSGSPLDFLVSGNPLADALNPVCSTAGQVVQGVVGFLGGPVSFIGGTLVGAFVGPPVIDKISTYLAGQAVSLNPKGSQFGNYINYGARLAANDQALSSGGRALSSPEEGTLAAISTGDFQQQFDKKSIAYRLFNPMDRRSLVAGLLDKQSPDVTTNVNNMALATLNVSHTLGSTFSNLLSGVAGAATKTQYDYGFPEVAFSESEMDNPNTENPYANGDEVAAILDSDLGKKIYIPYAEKCFGDTLQQISVPGPHGGTNQVWDVKYGTEPVNIYSADYKGIESFCNNTKDQNWLKVRFFIFDTQNVKAAACYQGDDQSCAEMGFNSSEEAGNTPGTPTAISGTSQELAKALLGSGRLSDQDGRYMAQIKAVANGNFSCNVNPDILKMLYGVVVQDNHSLVISSLNRFCTGVLTASGTGSYHYTDGGGHAIDVVGFDGKTVDGNSDSGTLGYLKEAAKFLPSNTGIGQVESCGSGFQIPDGDYAVPDECTHQHIQVPIKRLTQ